MIVLQLDGQLIGVMNLTLETGRELFISDTASNSRIVNSALQTYAFGRFI